MISVSPDDMAEWVLLPIVRALLLGASLCILHVGCYSSQGFIASLKQLIARLASEQVVPSSELSTAAGDTSLPHLLRGGGGPLARIHVLSTTDTIPGDAAVEVIVNYVRYSTRTDVARCERPLTIPGPHGRSPSLDPMAAHHP